MRRSIVLIGILALVASACGAAAENVAENLAERALESEGGGNVDLDIDEESGEVSVQMESGDGSGSLTIGGGELPDGFPIPVPDGGEVMSTFSSETEEGTSYSVTISYPADRYEELASFYEDWIDGQADDVQKSETSGEFTSSSFYSATADVNISVTTADEEAIVTLITGLG